MGEGKDLSYINVIFLQYGEVLINGQNVKSFFTKVDCVIKKRKMFEWIKKNGNPWSAIIFPLHPEPSKVAINNQMCLRIFSLLRPFARTRVDAGSRSRGNIIRNHDFSKGSTWLKCVHIDQNNVHFDKKHGAWQTHGSFGWFSQLKWPFWPNVKFYI